jgi:hypothetical protein
MLFDDFQGMDRKIHTVTEHTKLWKFYICIQWLHTDIKYTMVGFLLWLIFRALEHILYDTGRPAICYKLSASGYLKIAIYPQKLPIINGINATKQQGLYKFSVSLIYLDTRLKWKLCFSTLIHTLYDSRFFFILLKL